MNFEEDEFNKQDDEEFDGSAVDTIDDEGLFDDDLDTDDVVAPLGDDDEEEEEDADLA